MYDIPELDKIDYLIINNIGSFNIHEVNFVALCKIYNENIKFKRRMDITKSKNGIFVLTENIINNSYNFIKEFWNKEYALIIYQLYNKKILNKTPTNDILDKYKNALNNKLFNNKDMIFSMVTIYSLYSDINKKDNYKSFLLYNDDAFNDCVDIAIDIIYTILESV